MILIGFCVIWFGPLRNGHALRVGTQGVVAFLLVLGFALLFMSGLLVVVP